MNSNRAPTQAPDGARSYEGDELDLFSDAIRWKAYWSSVIAPYLGPRVLDVGAGLGATAAVFRDTTRDAWLALEPDPHLCDRMRESARTGILPPHVEVRCGSAAALDAAERFDSILYIDVLEHIEDDRGELERASRHLAPGGHLVILAPAHNWLYTPFDRAIGHFRRYSRRSLIAIKPPSLELKAMRYLDSVGMLASLGNRLLLRSARPTRRQIQLWDRAFVPLSRTFDPFLFYHLGKSIVTVFEASGATSARAANSESSA